MLTRALADDFPLDVRRRGEAYVTQDRVRLEAGSEHSVLAIVTGTQRYPVELWRKGESLLALCACPHFVDEGACQHLWAALVTAERRGLLRAGDPPERLVLEEHPDAEAIRELGLRDAIFDVLPEDEPGDEPGDELGDDGPAECRSTTSLESSDRRSASNVPSRLSATPTSRWGPRELADDGARAEARVVIAQPVLPLAPGPPKDPVPPEFDPPQVTPRLRAPHQPPARVREWKRLARDLAARARDGSAEPAEPPPIPADARIAYVLDLERSRELGSLVVALVAQQARRDGSTRSSKLSLRRDAIASLRDGDDRAVLSELAGARPAMRAGLADRTEHVPQSFRLERDAHEGLVQRMAATGRLHLRESETAPLEGPVRWAASCGRSPEVRLRLERAAPDVAAYDLRADVVLGGSPSQRLSAADLRLAAPGFLILPGPMIAPLPQETAHRMIVDERLQGPVRIPSAEIARATGLLMGAPGLPPLDAPDDVAFTRRSPPPRPRFVVRRFGTRDGLLAGELAFDYEGRRIPEDARETSVVDEARRVVLVRDPEAEEAARQILVSLRVRPPRRWGEDARPWLLSSRRLSRIVARLVRAGWLVEADGRPQRDAGGVALRLQQSDSGDWLELRGDVDFGGILVPLADVLRARLHERSSVTLPDGSAGLLPDEWLLRHAPWLSLGDLKKDHVRFAPSQGALLDALLEADPQAACDDAFEQLRAKLRAFDGLVPDEQPRSFRGALRDYQRLGLGWFRFLRETGFHGCLADDMGTGKTAQVLALLAQRHEELPPRQRRPSLVVAPRSLIFNWKQEAARFTPSLRVVDHSGPARSFEDAASGDVVLCTYGTLRRDVAVLREMDLDYVVLDEAQAIKNASTSAAKAARLLRCRHRLALSGTPVENHLGELWSLFEFLNPGMLGSQASFAPGAGKAADVKAEDREMLARAVRPFMLRRTKKQVARELPPRTEQTIRCAMAPPHRREYDELRSRYKRELLGGGGLVASRMHVLEALLRLRQLACHPGLVDPSRRNEPSAKLDLLIDRLTEISGEGHKALVFSQFTTLLDIVGDRLRGLRLGHERLDGSTRDRRAPVERFQADDDCRAFLISLKAGGTGLNLTSADYVFLLDPWWNPASEAQAIDRSHRIGQTKPVFAYRLISAGTVEERVLELQDDKRALADSLLGGAGAPLSDLRKEDLELLLS